METFQNDVLMDISNVENYTNANVENEKIYFSEFVQKLKEPLITEEKGSAGGFVGGWVQDKRANENVLTRSMLTLDIDSGMDTTKVWEHVEGYSDFACAMYSTHNSTLDKPRYRLVIPLKSSIQADEYKRVAKYVVHILQLVVDPASFTLSQLMNYPTCEEIEQYEFYYRDLPLFNVDDVPEVFGQEKKQAAFMNYNKPDLKQSPQMTDEEILHIASKAKNGEKFKALYSGDHSNYESQSEADQALCNYIAFYTQDGAQIDRIFMRSGLYREKWDRSDYKAWTIQTGIDGLSATYQKNDFRLIVNEVVKDSPSINLQEALKERRFEEVARMQKEWEENGSRGRKPSILSPVRCAVILPEYISFILFDFEENTRLAMYQPNEGIYTRNVTLIKRVISWLEPRFNNSRAEDVIYHLMMKADMKEQTESRYLIPVKNGVFNLETKKLEPFSPEYVFTTKISTDYIESPSLPVIDGWSVEEWLNSIACNDEEVTRLLWQVINDSLNGNYTRKKAIFLVGGGLNGKGTFQELITNLIGIKNIATLKINEFDKDFHLSVLEGKTAVIGDDVPVGTHIDDSSNFNSVVTGDPVLVNIKNGALYTATYRCTVIQSTNGMPSFKNKTQGTIRRVLIVPFKADFNGGLENFDIKEKYIRDEKVLQYVLHKAINLDFERFDIPKVSEIELEVFKQDNDPILDFKLSVFDAWGIDEVPKPIVYEFYKRFCESNRFKPLSNRKFHHQFKSYLEENWTDGQKRFRYDDLLPYVGDLDLMGIGFPNKNSPQVSYKKV